MACSIDRSRLIRTLFGSAILLYAVVGWAGCDLRPACRDCSNSSNPSSASARYELPSTLRRFYDIDDELDLAYKKGDFEAVKTLATEYLELAALYPCDWNFGNAIHDGNRMLGLAAMKQGDLDGAARYLRKSGHTAGSPQLDTFGPELDLANALLKAGRTEDVKAYLADIQTFWTMDDGRLIRWQAAISRGERPELERFGRQPATRGQVAVVAVACTWPLIVTAAFAYLMRRRLAHRRRYVVISGVVGYIAMFGASALFGLVAQPFLIAEAFDNLNESAAEFLVVFLPMIVIASLPALSAYLIARRYLSTRDAAANPPCTQNE